MESLVLEAASRICAYNGTNEIEHRLLFYLVARCVERDMYKAKFPLDELSRASKSGDQKKVLEAIGHLGEHAILRQDPDGIFVPALGLRFLVNEYKLSLSLYEPEEKMDMSSPELS